jgi:putative bacterial regulatory protein
MTLFTEEFMQFIAESMEDTVRILTRKKEQLERYRQQIEAMNLEDELMKKLYYILLQAALFYGQGITIQEIKKLVRRSRATIQKRLDKIPEKDLVKKKKRAIYYKINMLLFRKEKVKAMKAQKV